MSQSLQKTLQNDYGNGLTILDKLWRKGTNFLGTEYALLGGAMSWVSEHNLVAALSNTGGFGVLACGSMSPELLEKEIKLTFEKTKKPFGVNLITMHPQLDELVEICGKMKVSHVVLAGGLPKGATITKLKDLGIKTICFAPATSLVKKLVKYGVDALVIQGNEAGGHIGPIATSVLAQEILPFVNSEYPSVPVFVAGGIGRGEAIASYLEMGASGCQLGTRFVCASESIAHPKFKQLFIKSSSRDATPSIQLHAEFPVIPVRAIENNATRSFMEMQKETIESFNRGEIDKLGAQLKIEHFWAGALRKAVIDGDVENGSVMAGQSVGMVTKEQSMKEIFAELLQQAVIHLDVKQRNNG